MKQREISTAERLEAKLAIRAMQKHEQLWRAAEGRFGWRESVGSMLPLLLIVFGVIQLMRDQGFAEVMREAGGIAYLALGVVVLGTSLWTHTQRQLSALRELVRRLEQERS